MLPISKRGSVTLPHSLRRSLGLVGLENPMLIASEVGGKLVLEPATAIPVRDIPKKTIRKWISEDEAAMKAFEAKKK